MKIHPVVAELFHADRWTNRQDKANSHSSQYWKMRILITHLPDSSVSL
jgi:hypothetical protein